MLGTVLGDLDGLEIGINEGTAVGLWDGRAFVTKLGKYDGAEVGYLDRSTDGTADGKRDGLVLGSILGSVYVIELGIRSSISGTV